MLDTHSSVLTTACVLAVLLPLLRVLLNRTVFGPLGKRAIYGSSAVKMPAKQFPLLYKWNEAFWKVFFRVLVFVTGLIVTYQQPFFTKPHAFWDGCEVFPPCDPNTISSGLRLLYALELGFYLEAIPYLLFLEVRRKDFLENFAHHVATVALVLYSLQLNFVKVGSMVILCHEINDIFMESAKLARYASSPRLPTLLFAAFVVSWIASRLVYFPFVLIRSVYEDPPKIARAYGISHHPHQEIFLAMLGFLLLLHIYWSVLIWQMIERQLKEHKLDDIREEDP